MPDAAGGRPIALGQCRVPRVVRRAAPARVSDRQIAPFQPGATATKAARRRAREPRVLWRTWSDSSRAEAERRLASSRRPAASSRRRGRAVPGDRPGVGSHQLTANQLVVLGVGGGHQISDRAVSPDRRAAVAVPGSRRGHDFRAARPLPLAPRDRARGGFRVVADTAVGGGSQEGLLVRPQRLPGAVELSLLAHEGAVRPLPFVEGRDQLARFVDVAMQGERLDGTGRVAQLDIAVVEGSADRQPASITTLPAAQQNDAGRTDRGLDLRIAEFELAPRATSAIQ